MWRRSWWRETAVVSPVRAPKGYTYIGPCRCGTGPNAFYQDETGRIVHAWQMYHWGFPPAPAKEDLKAELDVLKEDRRNRKRRKKKEA